MHRFDFRRRMGDCPASCESGETDLDVTQQAEYSCNASWSAETVGGKIPLLQDQDESPSRGLARRGRAAESTGDCAMDDTLCTENLAEIFVEADAVQARERNPSVRGSCCGLAAA